MKEVLYHIIGVGMGSSQIQLDKLRWSKIITISIDVVQLNWYMQFFSPYIKDM